MEDYLSSIGILPQLVGFYADLLAAAGWHCEDDLLLEEPSLEDLERVGIDDEQGGLDIYDAILQGGDPTYGLEGHDHYDHDPYDHDPYDHDPYDAELNDEIDFDDIESRLDLLRGEIEELDTIRQQGDDWAVAMTAEVEAPFDRATFQRCYNYLEVGNTAQFIASLEGVNLDMQDPEDKNTLLHWSVSFNNPAAAQALIDRGAKQYMNKFGKAPVELALEAYENGDSSFFKLRNILGLHAQEMLRQVRC